MTAVLIHTGRDDDAQVAAHSASPHVDHFPKCIRCGRIIQIRRDKFIDTSEGPICVTKRCKRRCAAKRRTARKETVAEPPTDETL